MSELQKLMDWNKEFADRVFPAHSEDPKAPLHHLKKEVRELLEEIGRLENEPHIIIEYDTLMEYADCLILLVGSAKRLGFTAEQLMTASFLKMVTNERRDWGEPDDDGVYHHTNVQSETTKD